MRDPDRLDAELARWVDQVTVDLSDSAQVVAATRGVDTLHWVTPWTGPLADYARVGGRPRGFSATAKPRAG